MARIWEQPTTLAKKAEHYEAITAARHNRRGWVTECTLTTPGKPEAGFVHEAVQRIMLEQQLSGEIDAYTCGPVPMVDAVLPVLQELGVAPANSHVDKFTPASATAPNLAH